MTAASCVASSQGRGRRPRGRGRRSPSLLVRVGSSSGQGRWRWRCRRRRVESGRRERGRRGERLLGAGVRPCRAKPGQGAAAATSRRRWGGERPRCARPIGLLPSPPWGGVGTSWVEPEAVPLVAPLASCLFFAARGCFVAAAGWASACCCVGGVVPLAPPQHRCGGPCHARPGGRSPPSPRGRASGRRRRRGWRCRWGFVVGLAARGRVVGCRRLRGPGADASMGEAALPAA